MTIASTETIKLECKYCKVNLTEQSTNSVGFVTCPSCQRSYLKMPINNEIDRNLALSQSRKKVLDLFVDPSVNENIIRELKAALKAQEDVIVDLKAQKETINFESVQERLVLIENLRKTQARLEEITALNQDLDVSLNEANFELKRIQGVIGEKNQLMIKLKNELDTVSEKLRLREHLFEVLEKESGLKSSALANANHDLVELKNLCVEYEKKIAVLEVDIQNNQNKLNELIGLKNLCASYEEKIAALEIEIKENQDRLAELNLSLDVIPDLEVDLDKANATIIELQKALEAKGQESNENHHEVGADHISVLNEEINALKKDIAEYEATIVSLQNNLKSQKDVIKSKETEIYTLHHQTQELVKASPNNGELEQASLFATFESEEIAKLRDRVRRLEQTEQKLENVEIELDISRDELSKAQKEIVALNSLLEKAFYENQKSQVEAPPVQSEKLVNVAREIEKREDDLMEFSYELNNKLDSFVKKLGHFQNLAFDVAVIREDANGRVVSPLFTKGTLLPIGEMELKKVVTYKTILNKGLVYFKHEDDSNLVLNQLKIDFSSNSLFFLNDAEYDALTVGEVEVEIREEYTLNSAGELSVAFFRNNGFKRFDAKIGKLKTESLRDIEKFIV